jgi:hypothetical protein
MGLVENMVMCAVSTNKHEILVFIFVCITSEFLVQIRQGDWTKWTAWWRRHKIAKGEVIWTAVPSCACQCSSLYGAVTASIFCISLRHWSIKCWTSKEVTNSSHLTLEAFPHSPSSPLCCAFTAQAVRSIVPSQHKQSAQLCLHSTSGPFSCAFTAQSITSGLSTAVSPSGSPSAVACCSFYSVNSTAWLSWTSCGNPGTSVVNKGVFRMSSNPFTPPQLIICFRPQFLPAAVQMAHWPPCLPPAWLHFY